MIMPDWLLANDDDEWLEPHYNDTGEFGDNQEEDDDE